MPDFIRMVIEVPEYLYDELCANKCIKVVYAETCERQGDDSCIVIKPEE